MQHFIHESVLPKAFISGKLLSLPVWMLQQEHIWRLSRILLIYALILIIKMHLVIAVWFIIITTLLFIEFDWIKIRSYTFMLLLIHLRLRIFEQGFLIIFASSGCRSFIHFPHHEFVLFFIQLVVNRKCVSILLV